MSKISIILSVSCALLIAGGCGSGPKKNSDFASAPGSAAPEMTDNLTREEALKRSARVSEVRYELSLALDQTPSFAGTLEIGFRLRGAPMEDLRLDAYKGEIANLNVNGNAVPVKRTDFQLTLPAAALKEGPNVVRLTYKAEMQSDGTGLSRSVDPETKAVFLHSQFEAFEAHKLFPCFDQPDLKATLALRVRAPRDWQLITATRENRITADGRDFRVWTFPESAVMSTYVFSLHAGPFKVYEDRFRGMPLRLFVRPALAKYVDPKFWFDTTKRGLGFYNDYFGYAYPFKKYDQVIAPNFNAGAMENVAAVTFSERYVTRGKPTRDQQLDTANTILHEMAHMWFGDLTTMKWWNDLWLNESFATYMASLALYEATSFKESWKDFFTDAKQSAYWQDELSTTHPIETPVKDALDAFANFDGITYGKGASTMKQLSRWMGPVAFRDGVRKYFKTYAYRNTELADFISSLQTATKKDLTAWANVWLRQAGLDVVGTAFRCDAGQLAAVTIDVKASARNPGAAFRPQAIELAYFKKEGTQFRLLRTRAVDLTQPSQSFAETGSCPDAVLANYADHGYGKFFPDANSVEAIAANLSGVKDSMDRMMMWATLWHMVRDQRLPLTTYAEIALRHLEKETDIQTLAFAVRTLSHNRRMGSGTVAAYWPLATEKNRADRDAFVTKLENLYWRSMQSAAPGSPLQIFWWDAHAGTAQHPAHLDLLAAALDGKGPAGLVLDQDRRWEIVQTLCRRGDLRCDAKLAEEKKRDASDRGIKYALAADGMRPDLARKRKLFDDVIGGTVLTYHQKREITRALFPYEQRPEAEKFENEYFAFIRKEKNSPDIEFVTVVTSDLVPTDCSEKQAKKVQGFLDGEKDLPLLLYREVKETLDEDQRCQSIRALVNRGG